MKRIYDSDGVVLSYIKIQFAKWLCPLWTMMIINSSVCPCPHSKCQTIVTIPPSRQRQSIKRELTQQCLLFSLHVEHFTTFCGELAPYHCVHLWVKGLYKVTELCILSGRWLSRCFTTSPSHVPFMPHKSFTGVIYTTTMSAWLQQAAPSLRIPEPL